MLVRGVYPAAVTPFDEKGRVDAPAVARLLAWFEAAGCKGVVLAGTNGEGPSLSAVEKRDLLQAANIARGKLELILGIATPSLDEAVWLGKQAANLDAAAVLLMAPFYFRDATNEGIEAWFLEVMERSPAPVLVYNFPQKTGITITPEMMSRLARHERFAGLKDSSGCRDNLADYVLALRTAGHSLSQGLGPVLYVGNEELLIEALDAGWTGTISGAANVLPMWLSQIVASYSDAEPSRGMVEAKFELVLPCISALRSQKQPALNKALLHRLGLLPRPDLRAPLAQTAADAVETVAQALTARLGLRFGEPTASLPMSHTAG